MLAWCMMSGQAIWRPREFEEHQNSLLDPKCLANQPLKIRDIPISMVLKQLVEWYLHIQTPGSFYGQVGEVSFCLVHYWDYGACDHLSFTPSLIVPGERSLVQINSPSSIGVWEKPAELIVAWKAKLRFAGRGRGKLESGRALPDYITYANTHRWTLSEWGPRVQSMNSSSLATKKTFPVHLEGILLLFPKLF